MKQELKNALFGKRFLGATFIILICLFGLSIPEWISSYGWGAEYRQSALQQSIAGIFFGGIMLLLPFCSCIPYAINQVDEVRSSVMGWKMIRTSIPKYAVGKIVATALSGGGITVFAFAIHSLIWNVIAIPCNPNEYPYHVIPFLQDSLYATWYSVCYGLPMYVSVGMGMFIASATWATVALAVAIWIPDRLLTIAIPTCICYLLSAEVFRHLFGWTLLHPATLYNDALTATNAMQATIEYFIIFIIASCVYIVGLKRRGQNA